MNGMEWQGWRGTLDGYIILVAKVTGTCRNALKA